MRRELHCMVMQGGSRGDEERRWMREGQYR